MSTWIRPLLALVVGAHGIGHLLFLFSLLGLADWGQTTRSWLLGEAWLAKGLGALLWLVATAGFIAVAVGIFGEDTWWRPLALVAAAVSAVGLLIFWASPVSSPALSALVFDLLLVAALLVFNWPPVTQV
jgi:hypothetical protein